MQISISCFNCGFAVFGKAITRVDNASCDATCARCGTIVRLTVTLLHEGQHFNDAAYWYTYDKDNEKIPFARGVISVK